MKKNFLSTLCILSISTFTLLLTGCSQSKETEDSAPMELESMVIDAFEWGPAVDKIIVKPQGDVSSFEISDYQITTTGSPREITKIYKSDDSSKPDDNGQYITFEMKVAKYVGTPFKMNSSSKSIGLNEWVSSFDVSLSVADGKTVTVGKDELSGLLDEEDLLPSKQIPSTAIFEKSSYTKDDITLQTASYEPDSLKNDKAKNPLVIWLHGGNEGGSDVDIALLGNKVTSLTSDQIQNHFTSKNGNKGAYILALQCPTFWMQEKEGANINMAADSMYRPVLTEAINDYISKHDDVDPTRVYIGGCSNGGYMTINLMAHDTENVFAAAYPVCEAYDNSLLSDDDIAALSKRNIWFVQSINDKTVDPYKIGMTTYHRLIQAGAKNCWYSMFETVQGTDNPDGKYNGHWSWICLFNDTVTRAQNPEDIKNSTDEGTYGFVPSNDGGGTVKPQDHGNIYEWLNAQTAISYR